MRALITTILTTLVVVTLAAPASAGIPTDVYDDIRHSPPGEAACLVINEFVDGWYEYGGPPIPALRQLQNRVVGCDDSGSEAVKLVDRLTTEPTCQITDAFATAFENEDGQPEPFGSTFATTGQGLRTFEEVFCESGSLVPEPGHLFDGLPKPKDGVPEDLYPLYDAATVFPCAFLGAIANDSPDEFFGKDAAGGHEWLSCSENQHLPEGY